MLLLAASPVAAPVLARTHPLAALLIRDFFAGLCHQNPARSFALNGAPVAVCVRCLGIYFGLALGALLPAAKGPAVRWLALAAVLNLFDVITTQLHWHGNLPLPRFLFGLLLGAAMGAVLFLPNPDLQYQPAPQA